MINRKRWTYISDDSTWADGVFMIGSTLWLVINRKHWTGNPNDSEIVLAFTQVLWCLIYFQSLDAYWITLQNYKLRLFSGRILKNHNESYSQVRNQNYKYRMGTHSLDQEQTPLLSSTSMSIEHFREQTHPRGSAILHQDIQTNSSTLTANPPTSNSRVSTSFKINIFKFVILLLATIP